MSKNNLYVCTRTYNNPDSMSEDWACVKSVKVEYSFIPTLNLFREKYFDLSALEFTIAVNSVYEDNYTDKPVPVLVIARCLALNIPVSVDETTSYKGTKQTSSRVMNFHPVLVTDMVILPKNSADADDMYPVRNRFDFKQVSKRIHNAMFKISEIDDLYIGRTISKNYKEPIVFTFDSYYIFEHQIKDLKLYLNLILVKLAKAIKAGEKSGKLKGYNGKEDAHFYVEDRVQNVPEYISGLYKGVE